MTTTAAATITCPTARAVLAGGHRVTYELDGLLERDRRVPAGVAYLDAERNVGQYAIVVVDRVDREECRLNALYAVLFPDFVACARVCVL